MRSFYAIDICNTLADVNQMLQKALGPRPDASCYQFPGATKKFFRENPWVFSEALVFPGAVEGVHRLASAGSIIYLTARPVWAREITRKWLARHGFPEAEIICTKNKAAVARQWNVKLAVDDAPHEIDSMSSVCPVMVHAQSRITWATRAGLNGVHN